MTSSDLLQNLQNYIVVNYKDTALVNLCQELNISPSGLRTAAPEVSVEALINECAYRGLLVKLLASLNTHDRARFNQAGLGSSPQHVALIEGQVIHSRHTATQTARAETTKIQSLLMAKDHRRRAIVILLIFLSLGLFLSVMEQLTPFAPSFSTTETVSPQKSSDTPVDLAPPVADEENQPANANYFAIVTQILLGIVALLLAFTDLTGWKLREVWESGPSVSTFA